MNLIIPTILCGGAGTRLWPLSRSGYPKQFLALSGSSSGKSLFQETIARALQVAGNHLDPSFKIGQSIIVTNEDQRFLVLDQLQEFDLTAFNLILEPEGKNTAPALAMAALLAEDLAADPIMLVMPSDQAIKNSLEFIDALRRAVMVAQSGAIVTLGVKPTSPATGYGYIKLHKESGQYGDRTVEEFVEKPILSVAQTYLDSGQYCWNSGIFILKASIWNAALNKFAPDMSGAVRAAWNLNMEEKIDGAHLLRPDPNLFSRVSGDSIDYAVIEKCPSSEFPIKMIEIDVGWSDLGSWDAVWQIGKKDSSGNVVSGDALLIDTRNSLINASGRMVAVVGLDDIVVIETADAILVADKNRSQDVKQVVNILEKAGRPEKGIHRKVLRPWGWYDSVDDGDRFKVKRIFVKPGASLSLQMHHHRAEHWVVVKGVAEVTNGGHVIRLSENQSTYIPLGQKHRLSNPGQEPLEIIEVQSGSYLGEDDIVRLEDTYGRV